MKKQLSFITRAVCGIMFMMNTCAYAIPGVVMVTNTNNSGAGSLRQAILDVNSDPTIPHDIVFSLGSGVHTIQPTSALPAITSSYTFIDGSTSTSWTLNNPVVVLDGALSGGADGLTLSAVNNCCIRGLVINNGFNNGILITDGGVGSNHNAVIGCFIGTNQAGTAASGNTNGISIVGSTSFINDSNKIGSSTEPNIISGNSNYGVALSTNVNNSVIQKNNIGTDKAGTSALANSNGGISMTGSITPTTDEQCEGNLISGNVISGNGGPGITLNANCFSNFIQFNNIGVDATGASILANDTGIFAQGFYDSTNPSNGLVANNDISGNIISGNTSHAIYLNTNVFTCQIYSNAIGADSTGVTDLGNGGHGIYILGATNAPCIGNNIGFPAQPNFIKFNGNGIGNHYGILVDGDSSTPSISNIILENNIFANDNDGIKLLNGSNNGQSAPTILNAVLNNDGNSVTIAVTAPSSPSTSTFNLDFYINSADRTPTTEGETHIGVLTDVPAGATVVQLFPLATTMVSNIWVSATATDVEFGQVEESSEFCSNFQTATLPNNILPIMFQ